MIVIFCHLVVGAISREKDQDLNAHSGFKEGLEPRPPVLWSLTTKKNDKKRAGDWMCFERSGSCAFLGFLCCMCYFVP